VHYPPDYPNVIPDLEIATSRGELSNEEERTLMDGLKATVRFLEWCSDDNAQ
jgi:hypothetical protein